MVKELREPKFIYMNIRVKRYQEKEFKKACANVLYGGEMPFKYVVNYIFLKGENGSKIKINLKEWIKFETEFHWVGYEIFFKDGTIEVVDFELGKEDYIFDSDNMFMVNKLTDFEGFIDIGKKVDFFIDKYERFLDFG